MEVLNMNKPSKSQVLYERNMELQKAYAEVTQLEGDLRMARSTIKALKATIKYCGLHRKVPDDGLKIPCSEANHDPRECPYCFDC
jgi:hypothetical protein